jgi:hypothetical protein
MLANRWCTVLLGVVVVLASASFVVAQTPPASPPDAKALLLRMADFLGKSQQLSVTVRVSYDTVQPSGQKIEWNEIRNVVLRRPDRLRMEAEKSNGARTLVLFDGKDITTFDETARTYARAPQPGNMDETLVYFVRDLGMRLPLAAIFTSRAASDLERRVQSVEYVEKTGILGSPAHHLVGRTDTVNFQVWISDGDQPLPQRIVLTYPGSPGQPEFRALFTSWNLAPDATDARFTFVPPANANKIPFLAALPKKGPTPAGPSTKKGTK